MVMLNSASSGHYTHTHTRAHTSTHTSVLVLTIITAKAGGEQAGDNKTVDHIPILAVESPALSIYAGAWHLSAVGTHFMGLQDP